MSDLQTVMVRDHGKTVHAPLSSVFESSSCDDISSDPRYLKTRILDESFSSSP